MRFKDRFDRSKRRPSTRTQRIGFAFFWLQVLLMAYVIPTAPSFNTESHLYVTFSIVDRGTVNIDAFHRRLGDESYYRGHYYSDKAPGLSLLAVPVYAAFKLVFPGRSPRQYFAQGKYSYGIPRETMYTRYVITYLLLIVPAAIFGVLLWLFLSRFLGEGWALAAASVYSLGTTAFTYSMWYFSHQLCAMLLFGAFLLIHRRVKSSGGKAGSWLPAAGAGLLAGYAVISEYPTALIAALLGCYLLVVAPSRLRSLAAYAAGMLPPAVLGMAYNTAAFGKPFATGYQHVSSYMYHNQIHAGAFGVSNPLAYGVQAPSLQSVWEITFGSYRGIFLLCPVLLLFFAGLPVMWRLRSLRPELWLCVAIVVLYFLLDASRTADVNGWSGGTSVASRHLVPMLPFMVLPIAIGLTRRALRPLFVVLSAISLAMMSLIAAFDFSQGFKIADHNPLLNELWPTVTAGKTSINWGYMMGLHGPESLIPAVLVAAALVTRILWLFFRLGAESPAHEPIRLQAEPS